MSAKMEMRESQVKRLIRGRSIQHRHDGTLHRLFGIDDVVIGHRLSGFGVFFFSSWHHNVTPLDTHIYIYFFLL